MVKPIRNIVLLTLETTSGKTPERTFSPNSRFYSSKPCDKGVTPERGCMPWESCLEQKCPKRSSDCYCPSNREIRRQPRRECSILERCIKATVGLFHPDDTDFSVPNYDAKTYPMMQGQLKQAVPGAPMPGWEEIQKMIPKKPEGC